MNQTKIEERMIDLVNERFDTECSLDTLFVDLDADSLDMVSFSMEVEREFEIIIKDDELVLLRSVEEAVKLTLDKNPI